MHVVVNDLQNCWTCWESSRQRPKKIETLMASATARMEIKGRPSKRFSCMALVMQVVMVLVQ